MTRYYRIALTTALLGGLALPAMAQTLPPAAPAPGTDQQVATPSDPASLPPATDTAQKPAKTSVGHKHRHAVHKHAAKTPAPATAMN
jgi:ABC-type transport system substrate-binding protein